MAYSSDQLQKYEPAIGFFRERQLLGDPDSPTPNPMIPVDHSTLWRWVKSGHFPPPVKLGPNTTAWPVQVVYDWIKSKGGGL